MLSLVTRIQLMGEDVRKYFQKFADDTRGVTMLEYTILIGIITVAVILSVVYAGSWVASKWNVLTSALT